MVATQFPFTAAAGREDVAAGDCHGRSGPVRVRARWVLLALSARDLTTNRDGDVPLCPASAAFCASGSGRIDRPLPPLLCAVMRSAKSSLQISAVMDVTT